MKKTNILLHTRTQSGNAMIYILIALALFGLLTIALSNQNSQSDGQNLSQELALVYANELIEYATAAERTIEMMLASGSELNELDFVIPSDALFNTPPNIHKVFHPQGGGLNYQDKFNDAIQNDATSTWAVNTGIDVEWTKLDTDGVTPVDDAILTAYFINRDVCEIINLSVTGSTTIPVTASPHADYFLSTGTTDFDTTECAACEGFSSLCVENDTNDNYSFYNIIATR